MENRVCYPMTNVPEYLIGTVTVPSGGLRPGDVVVVSVADNSIEKNCTQYYAEKPTEDTLKSDTLAIVISGGNFEDLVDGRLPDGNPDYTTYVYEEGKTAPVLFLESRVMVYISDDCFSGNVEIGDVVSGVAGENKLSVDGDGLTKLSVEAKHEFRVGGVFGSSFITGNICRVLPSGGAGSGSRSGSLFIYMEGLASATTTDAETGEVNSFGADDRGVVEIPDVPYGTDISNKYSSIELSDV
jgi:hypothetical protein